MASCNHQIPSSRSFQSGRTAGAMAHPTMDRVPLASFAFFMVLWAQRTLGMRRFNWVDGCATYNHALHYRLVATLLHYGYHACPPICTWNHLLPLCSFHLNFLSAHHPGVHDTSFISPCYFYSMIEIRRLMNFSSFVVMLFAGHCRTSLVTRCNDLIIISQLSVVTSCSRFCHLSISSSKFDVEELSHSHESLLFAEGFTRSWSCAII